MALSGFALKGREWVSNNAILAGRLGVASIQAAAVYWLTEAAMPPRGWPATKLWLFEPMVLTAVYIPLLVLFGLGKVRARPLTIWACCATLVVAALGHHDAVRGRIDEGNGESNWPWFQLWIAISIGLFVSHVLVVDSVAEGRWRPAYPKHFDTAWKQGIQTVLAAVFVTVFWGVLGLGAGLFSLLNIDFFRQLLTKRWFYCPATTLALAVSIHVTDVQPALIRGARSVALTLFSWLTPLLSLIILGFLCSLPFVSLQPLWHTHFATGLLLCAAIALIFLINCCYQDGAAEKTTSKTKRLAGTIGAVELVPLFALAAWGLGLRVSQYGWSVERITAAALIIVIGFYALGYASAVFRMPVWLKRLEATNWVAAYIFLAILLALFSPIADPARLMVADQMARLKSGKTAPETFDFAALKLDGAGWGATALAKLRQGRLASNAIAQARINQVLTAENRYQVQSAGTMPSSNELVSHITVYPAGRHLPPSFLDPDFALRNNITINRCMRVQASQARCSVHYLALRPGQPEAILFVDFSNNFVFEQDSRGLWRKTGELMVRTLCAQLGLSSGNFTLAPHNIQDLVVGDEHLPIIPIEPIGQACPPPASHKTTN